MNLERLFENTILTLGAFKVTLSMLVLATLLLISIIILHRVFFLQILPWLLQKEEISPEKKNKLLRSFNFTLFLLLLLGFWVISGIDLNVEGLSEEAIDGAEPNATPKYITLTGTTIFGSLVVWQMAQFILTLFNALPLEQYIVGKKVDLYRKPLSESLKEKEYDRATRNFKYFVQTFAVLLIIAILDIDFQLVCFSINKTSYTLRVSNIISAILIILLARIVIWLVVRIFLTQIYNKQKIDSGSQFAITQLFQYIVYFIAFLLILNVMGMNPTVIAGSAAALLLGVGLGLQQTFNDFFSGILLLFERSVEVGDVVEVGGLVGTVRRIGLRTSQVQTTDNLTVIVPNSKLVTDTLTNWSHTDYLARFSVGVGVAYGTDAMLVKQLLLAVAKEHDKIRSFPAPQVRFNNFGDSSLDFELLFWSSELVSTDNVKSDLRYAIDQSFREHQIEIPFPQQDVWFKNPETLK